ncbi:MAG: HDIG domain-containing protein [Chloroflexi bacterium]|nr:HDIG domain-containing protein [Chloroflexota bacterium]MDA1145243.1 HDIG domain-containing protein [Chloroflexota bacterium]
MPLSISAAVAAISAQAARQPALSAAYLVGGAVRDALLVRPVAELDIASPTPAEAARALAAIVGSSVVPLGGPHELRRVPLEDGWIDVTPQHGARDADLARRDFTINALALPLTALPDRIAAIERSTVIDPHGGLADLDRRLIRQLAATAIPEDPLRALRAVRLATTLAFTIEANTLRSIEAAAGPLQRVAAERVGHELTLLFASPRSATGVRLLDQTRLLEVCFPELLDELGIGQRPHHTWDVLEHQLVALEWLDVLLAPAPPDDPSSAAIWHNTWDAPWPETRWGAIRDHLAAHAPTLRVATLLHDVGKPSTRSVEPDGRTRFFEHGPVGARIAASRLRTWRFPERTTARVKLLLQQHLRPGQVAAPGEPPSPAALHRFHLRLGDATPDVCLLFLADSLATAGVEELLPRWPAYVRHVQRIACWHPPASAQDIARIVDGTAVIAATGLPPGPAIGAILEAIRESAAAGDITDTAGALNLARRLAAEASPPSPPRDR